MNTQLSIVRQENVQLIAQNAPQIFNDNTQRAARCGDFGAALLAEVQQQGMSDELDQRCAVFIEKSRKTVRLMNEQRSPVTKLFDQIRAEFTALENSIDPTKAGTVPFQVQALRNQYAARKREEEERRRREELVRAQHAQAVTAYEQALTDCYRREFAAYADRCITRLTALNTSLTVENFAAVEADIRKFPHEAPADLCNHFRITATPSPLLAPDEAQQILSRTQARLLPEFIESYAMAVGDYKDNITDSLPAKLAELQRIAGAKAEEAARLKAELAAKEAAEAARLEAERKRKADEEEAAKKMQAEAAEMGSLFSAAQASAPAYAPKTQVKKRVTALDAEGVMQILALWWSKDGQHLPVDELAKMFKKQFTAVEKYANDKSHPELINSPHVLYEEEVKAR